MTDVPETDEALIETVWNCSKATCQLLTIRGLKQSNSKDYSLFMDRGTGIVRDKIILKSTFYKRFLKKTKIPNKSSKHFEAFENEVKSVLLNYTDLDRRMMKIIGKFSVVFIQNKATVSNYQDLSRQEKKQIRDKFYNTYNLKAIADVNQLGDLDADSIRADKRFVDFTKATDKQAFKQFRGKEERHNQLSVKAITQCYLEGYMPNFFEEYITDSEVLKYDYPAYITDKASHTDYRSEPPNKNIHPYDFYVDWSYTDEHLMDEFRRWLLMRRPDTKRHPRRRMKKSKQFSVIFEDFILWHVDEAETKCSERMNIYKNRHADNFDRKMRSVNQVRNSANLGLRFVELALIGHRYINKNGHSISHDASYRPLGI